MRRCDGTRALETAWQIHHAQAEWTGKVDAKAAFAFTVHSLLLSFALVSVTRMSEVNEWIVYCGGAALVVVGAVLAASVVAPSLKVRRLKRAARDNYIYFGHARHWNPSRLERQLRRGDPLPQISRQIVVMAEIAWSKHLRVGWSIWLSLIGGLMLLIAAVLSRL